ncbi:CGNR zinc finger domain-containing protein [Streptomyces sp. MP131-18]|uniref:CGNR zinc finger domain-containing protein n=1 Tax=Streptomyces sp. MP131-18 TaxID=1857892 RepID=UPI00097C6CF7|nr:CGNR zinc finger domain-containing protein [Streptomyces sp. MP131-18]ONK10320.1 hypothetical protein STBA_10420 [Streptomyces sp. MP131-18]
MLGPPPSAVLLQDFTNTLDIHLGTDAVPTPAALAAWLAGRGLLPSGARITAAQHAAYLTARAGLRELLGLRTAGDADPEVTAAAQRVLDGLPLLVRLAGRPVLTPAPGLRPLAVLAAAWGELVTTGDAARLKRCAETTCGEVFWDVSKNRSRRWCSMSVCGNRAKARRHATRRTPGGREPA